MILSLSNEKLLNNLLNIKNAEKLARFNKYDMEDSETVEMFNYA